MTSSFDAARDALAAWRADVPSDPYEADGPLRALVASSVVDAERRQGLEARASAFGRAVVAEVAPAVEQFERRNRGPELRRWDGIGRRVERVEFDGAYHDAGTTIWASGLVADSGTPGRAFEQATLLYLLSLEGEAGHACPAVCTIGMARALRRRAEPAVRERFLPSLLERDYARCDRASQFMTEVQGGSDVGANATLATAAGDGTYRVSGEKWFCSVAEADQFLITARVPGAGDGTRGLGCFAIPREIDGAPERVRAPPAEGQARHTGHGVGRDRLRRRLRVSDRARRGRLQDRGGRRAQHVSLAHRDRRNRADAAGGARSAGVRAPSTGIRSARSRAFRSCGGHSHR